MCSFGVVFGWLAWVAGSTGWPRRYTPVGCTPIYGMHAYDMQAYEMYIPMRCRSMRCMYTYEMQAYKIYTNEMYTYKICL